MKLADRLKGARVVVVGMARSGIAAVELLVEKGARVVAVDQNPVRNERLDALGIGVISQSSGLDLAADLLVLSPGVPADAAIAKQARAAGIPVVGDLEVASWFLDSKIIAITGSNGKTTTTAMTGHILQQSGIPAQVGGNIGTPPCSLVADSASFEWTVLEVSSFQLETTDTFRAHIGAILNITPDHLDRHYTFAAYAEAKARLLDQQQAGDSAVLNADDPAVAQLSSRGAAGRVWFSATRPIAARRGAWLDRDRITLDGESLMATSEVPLRGIHNVENTMAAAAIASRAGASHEQIRAAVMTFSGVEHRLEFVCNFGGVDWYNDSKATNVDAALKAIAAFSGRVWIILGGKDKDSDFTPLGPALRSKAHAALLIGAAARKIQQQIGGAIATMQCGTLEGAIEAARRLAKPGDTVLLAPACASFDQFENYEHRGRAFKQLVRGLSGEPSGGAA